MNARIAVVIPCYRVSKQVLDVIRRIGSEVAAIYVVDDKCPEESGALVQRECKDPRVRVIFNKENLGVGGAVKAGYKAALADQMEIVVKIDGDGQLPPEKLMDAVAPILQGEADYAKGNRFYHLDDLAQMPKVRLIGNAGLSFFSKVSSGYWNIMDPTNGYTAIHAKALSQLPLNQIHNRYFFESEMLFRLNLIRAVVADFPLTAHYADEKSSLRIGRVLVEFPIEHLRCFIKRILYTYFLRDFNLCSLQILFGSLLFTFGAVYGGYHWIQNHARNAFTPTGTVVLPSLFVILGFQLLLSAMVYDTSNMPKKPLSKR